jgi:hypothetical protein
MLRVAKKNGKHGVKPEEKFSGTQTLEHYGTRNHTHLVLVIIFWHTSNSDLCIFLCLLFCTLHDCLGAQTPEFARDYRTEYSAWHDGDRVGYRFCLVALLAWPQQPATSGFKSK